VACKPTILMTFASCQKLFRTVFAFIYSFWGAKQEKLNFRSKKRILDEGLDRKIFVEKNIP
jgi:hypothetical protein